MEVYPREPSQEQLWWLSFSLYENNMKYLSNPFYRSHSWIKLRREVLEEQRYECQSCKVRGYYTKADTVHHVNHLSKHPELALEKYYTDKNGSKQRNLVALCHLCHEEEHGFRQAPKTYLTEEKW